MAGAAAAGTTAVGTLVLLLARVVRLVAGLVFLLIALAIVLFDLKANPANTIVKDIHDAAKFLVSPFNNLFHLHSAKLMLTVNWGIAAVVYLIAGMIIAAILATPGHGLRGVGRGSRRA